MCAAYQAANVQQTIFHIYDTYSVACYKHGTNCKLMSQAASTEPSGLVAKALVFWVI